MAEFTPYLSEIRFVGPASSDFIEVVLDDGADPTAVSVVVYNKNGTIRSTNALDATPDNTIAGSDIYSVEAAIHKMGAVALVVDGTIVAFLSFNGSVTASEGPADGLTSTQLGTTSQGESLISTDMGTSYSVETAPDPGVIPCFLAGTLVDTPEGPRAVESIAPGDLVMTLDAGAQPVRWIGQRKLTPCQTREEQLYPVRIPAGALDNAAEIMVSPAHRIALAHPNLALLFDHDRALAPAGTLVGWNGIHLARDVVAPTYCHLMFDEHHLITTRGLISESFYPGSLAMSALGKAARQDLFTSFPALRYRPDRIGSTTRPCLKSHEVRVALDVLSHAA
ncbi:Hint domain-containing protein [Aliiroseovarius subalbicans]|uniref:Hint domain-containing protein n=1 Tax=Aliiroseovarius subalbicans TaxID=2925840 RepID=UPI001F5AC931|nr:Hint domain-containing protein [Aliiroseovarius subalbicans]MCI2399867.1 Hint domain-containing protein [Aliiroseovarius subalbicans]